MLRFLSAFVLFSFVLSAQPDKVDSLQNELSRSMHDTSRCRLLSNLIDVEYDDKKWPQYNEQLLMLCLKNLKDAQPPGNRSDTFFISMLCNAYNNRGYNFQNQGKVKAAIDEYNKCIAYSLKIGELSNLSMTYNNLGGVYVDLNMDADALKYFLKSLQLREKLNDRSGLAQSYQNIATVYEKLGNSEKCFEFTYKSARICSEIRDMARLALIYNNLGAYKRNEKDYGAALHMFSRALEINDSLGNRRGVCAIYGNIAETYFSIGKTEEARKYALKAIAISRPLGFPIHLQNHARLLFNIERKLHHWKRALEYYQIAEHMEDSLQSMESKRAAITQEVKLEYERQKEVEEINHQKELAVSVEREQKQKVITVSVAAGLFLVLLFSLFVANRLRLTSKQKKIIADQKRLVEEKQKEILDSITYAKRIQQASMSSEKLIGKMLKSLKDEG